MAKVILKDLTKKFQDVVAVDNMNLEIEDKEFLVLVGPSGCGKTTALRMVAGLEEITSGEVFIGERLVNDVPPKDRDIAMVFQNYALYPHMSVYDNMAFGLKLRKTPKAEVERRVKESAQMLGIEKLLLRKPKELSGGQRQRVALGRAIVREPKVFLMDEPLSNLDAKLRVQTRAELSKLHQRLGITTIYVTHDQVEAMTMGDRLVVLKDGVVQQVDTPMGLYGHPANVFTAGFIGSPAMNFIDCRVSKEDLRLILKAEDFQIKLLPEHFPLLENHSSKEVILGIRPEDIYDRALPGETTASEPLRVLVEVVEPMGSDAVLYLKIGNQSLVARVGPLTQAKSGKGLEVLFDLKKLHFFDRQTKKAITRTL